uniref:PDZ domain-containing protein n=1 Tax=Panagrolaimus superbus TaxID=310955 RepID=A0A914YXF8_9BILA
MQLPPPRLCRLQKHSLTDEFGFNLHAERGKGHFIGSVDKGGIGDHAGLVMGQRIVGVNDKLIYPDTPHKEVVTLIKKDPLCTELLVVSEDVDRWYAENGATFSFENAIRYNPEPAVILPRSSLSGPKRDIMEFFL